MAETSNHTTDSAPPRWITAAITVLSLPALFLGLSVPFIGPDEPRYAQVGREMLESGDWITPTLAGYHWFEKPPLLYWLEACFYSIFGVNEFAARLGPALCGFATVLCLWLLLRLAGNTQRSIADWSACIAASTLGLITFSHAATTDVVVTLPMTVALAAFFVYERRSEASKVVWPLILMYAAAGLALLAKGLIGVIFPPAIILFYYILSRRMPRKTLMISLLWGLPLTLAVAAVWYVPMYVRYGNEFIWEFLVRQHFERFTSNIFQHPQPFYFYLYVLPLMILPWLPFFLVGLWRSARGAIKAHENEGSKLLLFALAWIVVPVVFFSASGSKLPGYILPAIPGAIILSASAVEHLARASTAWRWISSSLTVVTLIGVSVALVTIFPKRAASESVKPLIDAAGQRGFKGAPIRLFHLDNFNAEFYAGDRLPRDPSGKQIKLYGAAEVEESIRNSGERTGLVIAPKEYLGDLLQDDRLSCDILAANREERMVAVTLK